MLRKYLPFSASPQLLAVISTLFIVAGVVAWAQSGVPAANAAEVDPGAVGILPDSPNDAPQQTAGQGDPSNLTATASGVGQVTLTWTAAPNATTHWIWSVRSNGTDGKWTDGGVRRG